MFVQVAHYKLGKGTVDDLRPRVEEGPKTVMQGVPGFVEYYAFDCGDGVVASVSVFADKAGMDEAERRLADWIEQTLGDFEIEPGHMSEGLAFATTRA